MAIGRVKWFDPKRGFGFIVNEAGKDVFIHYSQIDKEGFRALKEGQIVEYEQVSSGKGLQSKSVKIVELGNHKFADKQQKIES